MRTAGELLSLHKTVRGDPPRVRNVSHAGHQGWNIKLDALAAAPGEFRVFLRVNLTLPEQFSIGLVYEEPGRSAVVLVRLNGDHGFHPNPNGTSIQDGPHLHSPTAAERLLEPPDREWANGPAHATQLSPDHNHLAVAWKKFSQEVTLAASEHVSAHMSKVYAELLQTAMEGLL